jgi:hypothetical protein
MIIATSDRSLTTSLTPGTRYVWRVASVAADGTKIYSQWQPPFEAIAAGGTGGTGSLTLAGLTDVNLAVSTVQNGQVLTYSNGTWFSGYSVERINGLTDDVYITSPTGAISVATSATAGEVALDVNWPTLPSGVTAFQTADGGVLVQWHEPIPQEGPYVVEYQEISSLTAPNITDTAQV